MTLFVEVARVQTVSRDLNALRDVIRCEGSPAVQDAWDRAERWLHVKAESLPSPAPSDGVEGE